MYLDKYSLQVGIHVATLKILFSSILNFSSVGLSEEIEISSNNFFRFNKH